MISSLLFLAYRNSFEVSYLLIAVQQDFVRNLSRVSIGSSAFLIVEKGPEPVTLSLESYLLKSLAALADPGFFRGLFGLGGSDYTAEVFLGSDGGFLDVGGAEGS